MADLKTEATRLVATFDTINAVAAIGRIGSRGIILKEAIDDLRKELESDRPVADYKRDIGWAILMFDQANTNQLVVRYVAGGIQLRDIVEDIRKALGGEQAVWDLTRNMGTWREGYSNPLEGQT